MMLDCRGAERFGDVSGPGPGASPAGPRPDDDSSMSTMSLTTDPWRDRYHTPDAAALRKGLEAEVVEVFDAMRTYMTGIDDVDESPAWHGSNWCWSLEYRIPIATEVVGLLIPAAHDLQFAMPIDREFLGQLPIRRMKRAIRDGLDLASPPFDTTWAVWSLTPGSSLDDLQDLVNRRLKFEREAAAE